MPFLMETQNVPLRTCPSFLDVYCRVSDKARTQRAAIFYLLWEKQLFDFLNRGWDRVEARGIDLDKWMAM
jgi:hypothetical protein